MPMRSIVDLNAADRNSPQKHVLWTRIVLLTADGIGTNEIRRKTGVSKTCVWRWQERFANEGADDLLSDKTRPGRLAPQSGEGVASSVSRTLEKPPGETTYWPARAAAHAVVLSVDWKSKIQAPDCTQPRLPSKKRRCGTKTYDYKRHGTTTLFVTRNLLDGSLIGQCMQWHRHQKFIASLTR